MRNALSKRLENCLFAVPLAGLLVDDVVFNILDIVVEDFLVHSVSDGQGI